MKTRFGLKDIGAARFAAALVAVALAPAGVRSLAAEPTANVSTNIYGSGKQYKTTIERQSEGGAFRRGPAPGLAVDFAVVVALERGRTASGRQSE